MRWTSRPNRQTPVSMNVAAVIIAVASTAVTAAVIIGLFVWAAKKDGEEDRAVQRPLGIRRRTRLGR